MTRLLQFLRKFRRDDSGGMTIFGLYIFCSMAVIAGIAVDVSNLIQARTQLQITADAVAHAALYNRDSKSAADSKTAALAVAADMMPPSKYGTVLTANDIVFGSWNETNQVFTADANSRKAVLVTSTRGAAHANPVASFLMQFIGRRNWDVGVRSLVVTYRPTCFREGFVADGIVDIQSNNGFTNGFCMHSNTYVSMNNNNFFEPGTVVSMPDSSQIDLPNSGWKTNTGLAAALREGAYRLRIINQLPTIIAGLRVNDARYRPAYITKSAISTISGTKISQTNLVSNAINIVTCGNSGKLTLQGTKIENVVIVTTCQITFANSLIIENAIVATTSTDSKSMYSASGLVVGKNDNCASGGGAQLMTLGSMNFAADLHIYGSQFLAVKDINFAANANGVMGASMVAGGVVNGTSNMNMGFCGTGMESNFEAEYFRVAR